MENDKNNIEHFKKPKYQDIVDIYSKKLKKMRDFTNKPIIIK